MIAIAKAKTEVGKNKGLERAKLSNIGWVILHKLII